MFWVVNVLVFFRCGCVGMFWGMGVFGIFQVWVFWYISGCVCWYVSRCGCVGMFQVWRCWFVSGCGCVGMFQDVGVLVCFRVSMLMCHSAGSWVGYKMAAELDLIKSLCLLNPVCARPHK